MNKSSLLVGIGLTIFAGTTFASMDGLAKYLSALVPVVQVLWARYFVQTVIMAGYLARTTGTAFLRSRRPGLQILRGVMLFTSSALMYNAIANAPLADATATLFLTPILVTVLSVIFLAERIGIHRIAAVCAGFAGVLLIVRPGSAGAEPFLLLALAAAVANAIFLLLTRRLAGQEDVASTQFNTTAVGALILTALVVPMWETPSLPTLLLMFAMGVIGTLGHFCLVRAFVHAPASLLSPFLYSQVLFAGILSVTVFGDRLHPAMVAGTLLLIGSGLYIWWRERR